jgi:alanine racemase
MVKANAYGHHLDLVTPLLENADILAVSEIQEAQALRQITNKPILFQHCYKYCYSDSRNL